MKKEKLDDYELFYLEIPQSDYLNDLNFSADSEIDDPKLNEAPNLSSEQVSAIARDQLADGNIRQPTRRKPKSDDQSQSS